MEIMDAALNVSIWLSVDENSTAVVNLFVDQFYADPMVRSVSPGQETNVTLTTGGLLAYINTTGTASGEFTVKYEIVGIGIGEEISKDDFIFLRDFINESSGVSMFDSEYTRKNKVWLKYLSSKQVDKWRNDKIKTEPTKNNHISIQG